MATNPWGREIPSEPGAKQIVSDGQAYPVRETLKLASSFTITDSPSTGETIVDGGGVEGMTAVGLAIATAPTYAAVRTLLGLVDIETQESKSIAHAKAVCNFAFAPAIWRASAVQAFGSSGSPWPSNILSSSSTRTVDSAGETGGSTLFTTSGLSGGQCQWLSVSNGLGVFAPSAMPDLVRAQDRWHCEFDFRLNSTPDAQTELGVGWIATDGTGGPSIGVRGAQSTSFFRLFMGGTSTGVNSTIAVDAARHRARIWANGATPGTIYGSIDDEAPISMTGVAFGKAAGPYGQITNGTTLAAQNVNMFDAIYCFEGVA